MRVPISVAVGARLLLITPPAFGDAYDDCVLRYMGNARNEAAVRAIELACIDKASIPIPNAEFAGGVGADVGKFNMGGGLTTVFGIVVTVKNTTTYKITKMALSIHNSFTGQVTEYPVDTFDEPLPPGEAVAEWAPPIYRNIIKPGETRRFFVQIQAQPMTAAQFSWTIAPVRGIPGVVAGLTQQETIMRFLVGPQDQAPHKGAGPGPASEPALAAAPTPSARPAPAAP